jgi:hypothetical protein
MKGQTDELRDALLGSIIGPMLVRTYGHILICHVREPLWQRRQRLTGSNDNRPDPTEWR